MKPQPITDIDLAFPANVSHLMPKYEEIPDEFRRFNTNNKWLKFFNDMFYCGLENLQLKPKDGIDPKVAMRHIRAISGSFEPKHEHKEAAVAYLMSQWFDDVSYTKAKRS